MDPPPDHGEKTYKGSGRLSGKIALITGADSGIGRAVAIAFAREGADVAIAYLDEEEDAKETARWVADAGQKSLLLPGDITEPAHCRDLVQRTVEAFGRIDVLVNNAAYQMSYDSLEEITSVRLKIELIQLVAGVMRFWLVKSFRKGLQQRGFLENRDRQDL